MSESAVEPRISELQRRTPPWATGKKVRTIADYGLQAVSRREIEEWVKQVTEEQMKKGKRK